LFTGDFDINQSTFSDMLNGDDSRALEAEKEELAGKIKLLRACTAKLM
jgi:hypothetical protein